MTDHQWIIAALRRFEHPLILYARRIINDPERARDVVQDTFLKLCRRPREEVEPRLAEWLYTVCRNGALDVTRKERRMKVVEQESEPASGGGGPALVVERQEEGRMALELLAALPEKQREVLCLKFQGGLSYGEISRVTGE